MCPAFRKITVLIGKLQFIIDKYDREVKLKNSAPHAPVLLLAASWSFIRVFIMGITPIARYSLK